MKKSVLILNLTTLAILVNSPVTFAKEYETGKEIGRIEYQAKKNESRNIVNGVEQKIHGFAEKSKELVSNVKDTMQQKQYEHHMKAAQEAKAKAEQKAYDLQVESEESAKHAQESSARVKQIAALIEAEQRAIAEEEASTEPKPFYSSNDVAVHKYENYLLAAQRAKEKADHDALYYQLKSKKAAQQAYESALSASMIAKHIETEQKAHNLNEKFKKTMHESEIKN